MWGVGAVVLRILLVSSLPPGEPAGTEAHTFSKGIWKSVYTVTVATDHAAILHVTPHTKYLGEYPLETLVDGRHGGFTVNVTAHMWTPAAGASGTLRVAGQWASSATGEKSLLLPGGTSTAQLTITAAATAIKLWWPHGVGLSTHPLYDVTTTWTPTAGAGASAVAVATRRIGFRVFALVTGNDTAPGYVKVGFILCTVTLYANLAHSLTRSP